MKKRILAIVISTAMMFAFGGCNAPEEVASSNTQTTPVQSETPPSSVQSEIPSDTPSPPEPTIYTESVVDNIHISVGTEELFEKYDSMHEYIQNEEGGWIVIWPDSTPMKDFKFLAAYWDLADTLTVTDILFSVEKLSPDKPFAVKCTTGGDLNSGIGISFIDENGVERYYNIGEGGRGLEEAPPYGLTEFDKENVIMDLIGT